jgi:hypothetical protein
LESFYQAFIVGWNFYKKEKTTVKAEKRLLSTGQLSQGQGIPEGKNYNSDEWEPIKPKQTVQGVIQYDPNIWEPDTPQKIEYQYPPKWQCVIAGLFGSGVVFAIVIFGLVD